MATSQGKLVAPAKAKFAIVVSRFNEFIRARLLAGAIDALQRHGVAEGSIDVVWSPGSFETPMLAMKLAESKKYAAVICLGAVIRGDTPHWDYIAAEASKGLAQTAMEFGVPVSFGVLTCDTLEQAIDRAGAKSGNKGFDAAMSAVEMGNLMRKLRAGS